MCDGERLLHADTMRASPTARMARCNARPAPGGADHATSLATSSTERDVWIANRAFGGNRRSPRSRTTAATASTATERHHRDLVDVNGDGAIATDCNADAVPTTSPPCRRGVRERKSQEFFGLDDEASC